MQTQKYARKPFLIDAVQITVENMEEVAGWCKGEIVENDEGVKFIKVKAHRPIHQRQREGHVNDYLTYVEGKGVKVYPEESFNSQFEPVFIGVGEIEVHEDDEPLPLETEGRNVFERNDGTEIGTTDFGSLDDPEPSPSHPKNRRHIVDLEEDIHS